VKAQPGWKMAKNQHEISLSNLLAGIGYVAT
jgi:hypothetical protein